MNTIQRVEWPVAMLSLLGSLGLSFAVALFASICCTNPQPGIANAVASTMNFWGTWLLAQVVLATIDALLRLTTYFNWGIYVGPIDGNLTRVV